MIGLRDMIEASDIFNLHFFSSVLTQIDQYRYTPRNSNCKRGVLRTGGILRPATVNTRTEQYMARGRNNVFSL